MASRGLNEERDSGTSAGHDRSLAKASFPEVDEGYLVADTVEIPVQVNGKVRSKLTVAVDTDADGLEAAALADERIRTLLVGATVRKIIAVPNKVVNLVIG